MFNYGQDTQTKSQRENKGLEAQDKPSRHIQKTHFFSSAQKAFFDTNQLLTHKISFNKLKKIEDVHPLCL